MTDPARGMLTAARRVCPTFTPRGPLWHTGTSALLPGTVGTTTVVAKRPIDLRPFWIERCRHEIAVYHALRAEPPTLATPSLVGADPHEPLLLITAVAGRVLHPDRYPTGPVADQAVTTLLDTLDRLHDWSPPVADGASCAG